MLDSTARVVSLKMLSKDKERFGQQRKAFSLDMGDLERDKGDFNM